MYRSGNVLNKSKSAVLFNSNSLPSTKQFCSGRKAPIKHQFLKKDGSSKIQVRYNARAASSALPNLYIAGSALGAGIVGLGSIVYAAYDEDFRKKLQQSGLPVKGLLNGLLGELKVSEEFPLTISEKTATPAPAKIPEAVKRSTGDSGYVSISVLDQPAISQIDIDMSKMGAPSPPVEIEAEKADVAEVSDVVADSMEVKESVEEASPAMEETAAEVSEPVVEAPVEEQSPEAVVESVVEEVAQTDVPTEEVGSVSEEVQPSATESESVAAVSEESSIDPPSDEPPPPTEAALIEAAPSDDAPSDEVEQQAATEEASSVVAPPISSENTVSQAEQAVIDEEIRKVELEVSLGVAMQKLSELNELAIHAQVQAADSIHAYIKKMEVALSVPETDDGFQATWQETAEYEHNSQSMIDSAKNSELEIQGQVDSIMEMIQSIRAIQSSGIADKAAEDTAALSLSLKKATDEIRKACADFSLMQDYQSLLRKAKDRFESDLREFTPDLLKLIEDDKHIDGKLPASEALLAFAMKKAEYLALEIENEKIREKERLESMLEKQRVELEVIAEQQRQEEILRVKQEEEQERQRRESELMTQYETEMRTQLKRQAGAHREHLAEVLQLQEKELGEKHAETMDTALKKQQAVHDDEVEEKVVFVDGMEEKVSVISDIELKQRKAQELWMASQALNGALEKSLVSGRTRSLMPELMSILNLSDHDEVMKEVVSNIPEEAALLGVSTERDLTNRFADVKAACKKVAMVGDDGGNMWSYLVSYLKSFVASSTASKDNIYEPVDVESISPYELLDKADICVQVGDLEQAARFMSQLRGVSRKLSSDWLNEVRLYLETKQTAQLLLAYAASLSVAYE